MGGVTWERLPIDPKPGPRSAAEIVGGEGGRARGAARGAGDAHRGRCGLRGVPHGRPARRARRCWWTPASGPRASRRASRRRPRRSASTCSCSWTSGGDVLGAGSEPGLASPLCDAVMLAAGALLAAPRGHRAGRGVRPRLRRRADRWRSCSDGSRCWRGAGALLAIEGLTPGRRGRGRAGRRRDSDRGQRAGRALCARRVRGRHDPRRAPHRAPLAVRRGDRVLRSGAGAGERRATRPRGAGRPRPARCAGAPAARSA